jgi:hypothetical protein
MGRGEMSAKTSRPLFINTFKGATQIFNLWGKGVMSAANVNPTD